MKKGKYKYEYIWMDQKLANTKKKTNIRPGICKYENKYKYLSQNVQLCLRLHTTSLAK